MIRKISMSLCLLSTLCMPNIHGNLQKEFQSNPYVNQASMQFYASMVCWVNCLQALGQQGYGTLTPQTVRNVAQEVFINNHKKLIKLSQTSLQAFNILLTDLSQTEYDSIKDTKIVQIIQRKSIQELVTAWHQLKIYLKQVTDALRNSHEEYCEGACNDFYYATCSLFNTAENLVTTITDFVGDEKFGNFVPEKSFVAMQTQLAPIAAQTIDFLQTANAKVGEEITCGQEALKLRIAHFDNLVKEGASLAGLNRAAVAILFQIPGILAFIDTLAQKTDASGVQATAQALHYALTHAQMVLADDEWFNQLPEQVKQKLVLLEINLLVKLSTDCSRIITDRFAELNEIQ